MRTALRARFSRVGAFTRTPSGAAVLSLVFPGLGQLALGRRRRALLVAVPAFVATAVVVLAALFVRHQVLDMMFRDSSLVSFLLIDLVLLLYRVWAVLDAYLLARPVAAPVAFKEQRKEPVRRPRRGLSGAVLAVALILTVSPHLAFGAVDMSYRDMLTSIFGKDAPGWFGNGNLASGETAPPIAEDQTGALDDPTPSITVGESGTPVSGSPVVTPSGSAIVLAPGPTTASGIPIFPIEQVSGANTSPDQWRQDGYLNVLLAGVDEGVGRWSLRTDTMILLRTELSTGRSVMFGIPRNLENIPLPPESANAYPCHCFPYPNLLNSLWRDAVNRPSAYPYAGSDFVRGFKALEGAVGQYLGVHVDGVVVINLMGFVKMIDALGGLNINVPKALHDSQYSRPQDGKNIVLDIPAGQQHMDGLTALAYARSRHQDSDYGRMGRQQAVLMALRAQLNPCSLLPQVPSLISALGDAFWTDMPIADAGALVGLAAHVGTANVKNIELVPSVTGNPVGFLTVPRWATVRNIVAHGLDGVPAAGSGGSSGGGFTC